MFAGKAVRTSFVLKFSFMLTIQVPFRHLNNRYQPMGTVQSKQLGNLKRLQMANMIWQN